MGRTMATQEPENPPPPATAAPPRDIAALEAAARSAHGPGKAPVETWNPPYCGDLDIRIAGDGTWYYLGSPIGRRRLTRLFASVLRRDADGRHYLVTPVEKIGIRVDDAPFLAVEMAVEGTDRAQRLAFRTNVDDVVVAGGEHPIRFVREAGTDGLKPYVTVRGRLEALVTRSVFHDLVALGVSEDTGSGGMFGVWSAGQFFVMAPADEVEGMP
jgi:uncharacterized protein